MVFGTTQRLNRNMTGREVGRQTVRGTISSPPAHSPARAALVADPLWGTPETWRGHGVTPVACRPADPASRPVDLHAKQQKSVPAVNYFDPGFVVGMPGGGVYMYEQRRVSHLQNITILSPDSGSAPSHWSGSRSRGMRSHGITL